LYNTSNKGYHTLDNVFFENTTPSLFLLPKNLL
jgi:hypothetical protein